MTLHICIGPSIGPLPAFAGRPSTSVPTAGRRPTRPDFAVIMLGPSTAGRLLAGPPVTSQSGRRIQAVLGPSTHCSCAADCGARTARLTCGRPKICKKAVLAVTLYCLCLFAYFWVLLMLICLFLGTAYAYLLISGCCLCLFTYFGCSK